MTLALFAQAWLTASAVMATPSSTATASDAPIGLSAKDWEDIHTQIRADLNQQAYLKASNTSAGDLFGDAVAIAGDTLVVGAPLEKTVQNLSGAAYVFVRNLNRWEFQAQLKSSEPKYYGKFGQSVSISGDTIVVGAIGEFSNQGRAHVYIRSEKGWTHQAVLQASNAEDSDYFGWSVAISGETIVVGARNEESDATGIDGEDNNNASDSGAAYVFTRKGTAWTQSAYLKASNTDPGDMFGYSVAISGNIIIIGAPYEDGNSTGVNGTDNNNAPDAGATYVFVRDLTGWRQEAYLKAPNTGEYDYFGFSGAAWNDTLVIGALCESSDGEGGQDNNDTTCAGAAYVYMRTGGIYTRPAYLKASDPCYNGYFGHSVALADDTIIIGSPGHNSNEGKAYIFIPSATDWFQQATLKAGNNDPGDEFGSSVSVSSGTFLVGAYLEDGSATGVNGPDNNNATNAGAAYVFGEGTATLEVFLPLILR